MQKFGIGQPATRFEDGRLLSGKGRYVEDIAVSYTHLTLPTIYTV